MLNFIFFFTLLGAGKASWCKNVVELTSYSGDFSSPLHDSFYPSDITCTWRITAPQNLHVELTFATFDLEDCKNCDCDSVTVYDVTQHNGNVTLGKFCGKNKPRTIYSSWRYLIIVFTSDHGDSKSGFLAGFAAVQRGRVCKSDQPIVITNGGAIISPDFSSTYPSNSKCLWVIESEPISRIRLKFSSFEVENCSAAPGRCQCDFVEVRDGNSSSAHLIGRFCGRKMPPDLYSSGRYLWIYFRSDNHVNKRGFIAEYYTEKIGHSSCPSNWKYPFQCPKNYWNIKRNVSLVCCYANQAGCCASGGSYCADSGKSERTYCPRPSDDSKFTRCCLDKKGPSCCLSQGHILRINRLVLLTALFINIKLILIIR